MYCPRHLQGQFFRLASQCPDIDEGISLVDEMAAAPFWMMRPRFPMISPPLNCQITRIAVSREDFAILAASVTSKDNPALFAFAACDGNPEKPLGVIKDHAPMYFTAILENLSFIGYRQPFAHDISVKGIRPLAEPSRCLGASGQKADMKSKTTQPISA